MIAFRTVVESILDQFIELPWFMQINRHKVIFRWGNSTWPEPYEPNAAHIIYRGIPVDQIRNQIQVAVKWWSVYLDSKGGDPTFTASILVKLRLQLEKSLLQERIKQVSLWIENQEPLRVLQSVIGEEIAETHTYHRDWPPDTFMMVVNKKKVCVKCLLLWSSEHHHCGSLKVLF